MVITGTAREIEKIPWHHRTRHSNDKGGFWKATEVKIKFMSAISRATMAERWWLSIVFNIFYPENFQNFISVKIETKFRNIIRHNKEKVR